MFSVLYGFWVANFVAFNGDVVRELAAQFLTLAEKQGVTAPRLMAHRFMGISLMYTGEIVGRPERTSNRRLRFTDPAEHRPLATRFGLDAGVQSCPIGRGRCGCLAIPMPRSQTLNNALRDAREIGQAATLMYALVYRTVYPTSAVEITRRQTLLAEELVALADEKGALFWKAVGTMNARLRI